MTPQPDQLMGTSSRVSAWRFVVQGLWVALRLIAVFYLGQAGERFFYQGF